MDSVIELKERSQHPGKIKGDGYIRSLAFSYSVLLLDFHFIENQAYSIKKGKRRFFFGSSFIQELNGKIIKK